MQGRPQLGWGPRREVWLENLLRACESRKQVRDGGDTPSGNVESTVACCYGRACRPAPHVHPRHPGPHFAGPFSDVRPHSPPRRPRRPLPGHWPCCTFSHREHAAQGAPKVPRALGTVPMLCRFPSLSSMTEKKGQDISAAAEKRARWNCRWHPTMASVSTGIYTCASIRSQSVEATKFECQ